MEPGQKTYPPAGVGGPALTRGHEFPWILVGLRKLRSGGGEGPFAEWGEERHRSRTTHTRHRDTRPRTGGSVIPSCDGVMMLLP